MRSLDSLNLTPKQLHRLFSISLSALDGAAHDLKTPLAILEAYTGMLQAEPRCREPNRLNKILDEMLRVERRLRNSLGCFFSWGGYKDEDPFIAQPRTLVELIRSAYSRAC